MEAPSHPPFTLRNAAGIPQRSPHGAHRRQSPLAELIQKMQHCHRNAMVGETSQQRRDGQARLHTLLRTPEILSFQHSLQGWPESYWGEETRHLANLVKLSHALERSAAANMLGARFQQAVEWEALRTDEELLSALRVYFTSPTLDYALASQEINAPLSIGEKELLKQAWGARLLFHKLLKRSLRVDLSLRDVVNMAEDHFVSDAIKRLKKILDIRSSECCGSRHSGEIRDYLNDRHLQSLLDRLRKREAGKSTVTHQPKGLAELIHLIDREKDVSRINYCISTLNQ